MTIDNAALRQFIMQFFSDEELEALCFDYFPEVSADFGSGMSKGRKVIALIGHCERRGRLADLHAAVARERPEAWQRQFAAVETKKPSFSEKTRFLAERDPRQIFLSHATADAEFAHILAADLRAESWRVWIAPESIRPGEKWVEAIDRGLETSGVFLVVLTPEAVASRWVRTETSAAIGMEHKDLIRFIPLDVAECQPPWLWTQYQYVPFRGSYEVGLDELLRWLDGELVVPESERPLPGPLPEGEGASAPVPPPRERYVKEEQWRQLQALAHEIAAELGRQSGDDETREVYRRFNRHFGLTTYKKLPRRRFSEGLEFLSKWRGEVIAASPSRNERLGGSAVLEEEGGISPAPPPPRTPAPPPDRRIHEKTGIELIRIPAGPFLYGSADSDEMADHDEKPQRTIDLPEYWISRTPVTNAQFAHFVQATNHRTTAEQQGYGWVWMGNGWGRIKSADWRHPIGPESSIDGKDNHPVVQVSWNDAKAFCDWAALILPTEEQWEKAARGSDGRIWPWGNEEPTNKHCNFGSNVGNTTPAGKYSPKGDSPYGCTDMAGNVWEWTGSWYEEGSTRALRGGSWYYNNQFSRAAHRDLNNPYYRNLNIGFRVAELLSDPDS
jgi:formylglycine-generating enzyme required for sulfatase activity